MGGSHAHEAHPESVRMRRWALMVLVPFALLTVVAMVLLWPGEVQREDQTPGAGQLGGEVVSIDKETCAEEVADEVNGCGTATVKVTDVAEATETEGEPPAEVGEEVEVSLPNGPGAPRLDVGDDVLMLHMATPDGQTFDVVDHRRGSQMWVLAAAFVLAVVAFGRWRGVTSLAGLALTFFVLLHFVVPGILGGESPVVMALVGSAFIVLSVMYLTHGFSLVTTVAMLGTIASLALTGVLAWLAVWGLHLSGVTDDISTTVGMDLGVDMRGLLLAGIVIGSLGVLDDVTVTQSATVAELARANPDYGVGHLYRAAARVGRAHIASVINTIILAYAGSTLPLLVLIVASNPSLGDVVSDQVLAQEIVRSAVATIGLVAAVPLTTALAAVVAGRLARD
ncbi:YibE/F family protein [Nocardioides jishulii]|nr:YibE/F family protein [Nocardioides jishulii]